MFGRRQRPALTLLVDAELEASTPLQEKIEFRLMNLGRAIARYAGFLVRLSNAQLGQVVGPYLMNASQINQGRPTVTFDLQSGVIHPNGIRVSVGHAYLTRIDATLPVECECTVYCEGMAVEAQRVVIQPIPSSTSSPPSASTDQPQ